MTWLPEGGSPMLDRERKPHSENPKSPNTPLPVIPPRNNLCISMCGILPTLGWLKKGLLIDGKLLPSWRGVHIGAQRCTEETVISAT